jgi:hypothetical protein
MNHIPTWNDCERCPRHAARLAVRAPAWGPDVQVVVFGVRASWASQAANAPDAHVARLVRRLREGLGLTEEQCVADALVACGAGGDVLADHVAACSARLVAQSTQPRLVVFAGLRAEAISRDAGLLDKNAWAPLGISPVPALTADPAGDVVAAAATALGRSATVAPQPEDRTRLQELAGEMHRCLGGHGGQRTRLHQYSEGEDAPEPYSGPVRVEDVVEHLAGRATVTPTRSQGPWPFVVVRVPRRSALEAATADATTSSVRAALPTSFEVHRSSLGETQFYVNVPGGMSYGQAALLLRCYFSARGLRWQLAGARSRSTVAEAVAVPTEPVALPFGLGWQCDKRPLEVQLESFLDFLSSRDTCDFERAESAVEAHFKVGHRWTPTKRTRLREALLEEELALEGQQRVPQAWATALGGHWPSVAADLSPAATRIAALGLRHDGVRDRWLRVLIDELVDLVSESTVNAMVSGWLDRPEHVDELVVANRAQAKQRALRLVARKYKALRGVPVRFWDLIEPREGRGGRERAWDTGGESERREEVGREGRSRATTWKPTSAATYR